MPCAADVIQGTCAGEVGFEQRFGERGERGERRERFGERRERFGGARQSGALKVPRRRFPRIPAVPRYFAVTETALCFHAPVQPNQSRLAAQSGWCAKKILQIKHMRQHNNNNHNHRHSNNGEWFLVSRVMD